MTVWSFLTASDDPTSPSSPTLPAGQPKNDSNVPPFSPSPHPPPPEGPYPRPPSSARRKQSSDVALCELHFTKKEEVLSEDKYACSLWALKTDHEDNTTLHFLVVMLYTEQASLRGNVVQFGHKLGCRSMSLERSRSSSARKYQPFLNSFLDMLWTKNQKKNHHVSRECVC